MRHVRLGQTGLEVSAIAFGTWAFGGDWGAVDVEAGTDAGPGRQLPVAAAARGWLERAAIAGAEGLDYSAVVATIVAGTSGGQDPNGHEPGST